MDTKRVIVISTAGDFAQLLRAKRLEARMSQATLAHIIAKSRKWVIGVERGHIMPTLPAVIEAARALGFSLALKPHDQDQADLLARILGEK